MNFGNLESARVLIFIQKLGRRGMWKIWVLLFFFSFERNVDFQFVQRRGNYFVSSREVMSCTLTAHIFGWTEINSTPRDTPAESCRINTNACRRKFHLEHHSVLGESRRGISRTTFLVERAFFFFVRRSLFDTPRVHVKFALGSRTNVEAPVEKETRERERERRKVSKKKVIIIY